MRPPEFTGGNQRLPAPVAPCAVPGFNEAAGIHRRKLFTGHGAYTLIEASMRPPECGNSM